MLGIDSPTAEGLLIDTTPCDDGWTTVREVGKLAFVVWEYRVRCTDDFDFVVKTIDADATVLLRRIAELEAICTRLRSDSPISIELHHYKWNLKKAKERLRRWYRQQDTLSLDISADLQPLLSSILSAGSDQASDPTSHPDFLIQAYETGDIGVLEGYVRRKLDRPPLILSRIPQEIASLLTEANESYRLGTFRGVAALCRATIEKTLQIIFEVGRDDDLAVPYRDKLEVRINSLPDRLLTRTGRESAHDIRRIANGVLHRGRDLSEDEAWRLLVQTTRIVQALLDRSRSLRDT
jgi:hypothetical protein